MDMKETRATAESGGQKGRKPREVSMIPPRYRRALTESISNYNREMGRVASILTLFEAGIAAADDLDACIKERLHTAGRLIDLADVYGMGSVKYERANFLKGYPWSWTIDAAWRHLILLFDGEFLDKESRLPHDAHITWHLITLREFVKRKIGTDDRLWLGDLSWEKPLLFSSNAAITFAPLLRNAPSATEHTLRSETAARRMAADLDAHLFDTERYLMDQICRVFVGLPSSPPKVLEGPALDAVRKAGF